VSDDVAKDRTQTVAKITATFDGEVAARKAAIDAWMNAARKTGIHPRVINTDVRPILGNDNGIAVIAAENKFFVLEVDGGTVRAVQRQLYPDTPPDIAMVMEKIKEAVEVARWTDRHEEVADGLDVMGFVMAAQGAMGYMIQNDPNEARWALADLTDEQREMVAAAAEALAAIIRE
jgi:hypothetical protein